MINKNGEYYDYDGLTASQWKAAWEDAEKKTTIIDGHIHISSDSPWAEDDADWSVLLNHLPLAQQNIQYR